jgi:hypothetical protein
MPAIVFLFAAMGRSYKTGIFASRFDRLRTGRARCFNTGITGPTLALTGHDAPGSSDKCVGFFLVDGQSDHLAAGIDGVQQRGI